MSPKATQVEALIARGAFAEAKAALLLVLRRKPDDAECNSLMSVALARMGDDAGGELYARRTAELLPKDPYARHNLGNLLVTLGKHEEAARVLETALRMMRAAGRDDAQTVLALSNALSGLNRHGEAAELLAEALKRHPDEPRLLNNHAANLHAIGQVERALPILRRAHERAPTSLLTLDQLCAMENYAPGVTNQERIATHRRYGALAMKEAAAHAKELGAACVARPSGGRPLRVGLLSADLRSHSVAYFVAPLLEHADKAAVEFFCYHVGTREDAVSARLRSLAAGWKHLPRLSALELARTIRADELDALVEWSGHTTGHRLMTMAQRAAPVQLTYFGYPNTTGVPTIDYRIVDAITDLPGAEVFCTEKLLRLDPVFLCYSPPRDAPGVSELPCGGSGGVTFGSFGSLLKYNGAMIGMWADVLRGVPDSRLVLMHHGLAEQKVREGIVRRFESAGVERSRIDARPPSKDASGTLPAYQGIDISLDTFPYNGTTTICESLFMGVPMVTMFGDSCASRVGLSVLRAVGLEKHAAGTAEEFVKVATELASPGARGRLIELRATLRERFMQSAAGDGPRFAKRFIEMIAGVCGKGAI